MLLRSDYEHVRRHGLARPQRQRRFFARAGPDCTSTTTPAAMPKVDLVIVTLKSTENHQFAAAHHAAAARADRDPDASERPGQRGRSRPAVRRAARARRDRVRLHQPRRAGRIASHRGRASSAWANSPATTRGRSARAERIVEMFNAEQRQALTSSTAPCARRGGRSWSGTSRSTGWARCSTRRPISLLATEEGTRARPRDHARNDRRRRGATGSSCRREMPDQQIAATRGWALIGPARRSTARPASRWRSRRSSAARSRSRSRARRARAAAADSPCFACAPSHREQSSDKSICHLELSGYILRTDLRGGLMRSPIPHHHSGSAIATSSHQQTAQSCCTARGLNDFRPPTCTTRAVRRVRRPRRRDGDADAGAAPQPAGRHRRRRHASRPIFSSQDVDGRTFTLSSIAARPWCSSSARSDCPRTAEYNAARSNGSPASYANDDRVKFLALDVTPRRPAVAASCCARPDRRSPRLPDAARRPRRRRPRYSATRDADVRRRSITHGVVRYRGPFDNSTNLAFATQAVLRRSAREVLGSLESRFCD